MHVSHPYVPLVRSTTVLVMGILVGLLPPETHASSGSGGVDPIAACNLDPRVWMNMVSLEVCAGSRVFFDEEFDGNGRTCATCHPVDNNFTVEPAFIAGLPPDDPMFVAETIPGLAGLETGALRTLGLIKENIDGFEDNDHKFVMRSVPHTLSMATSIDPDATDGTDPSIIDRTGWSGDGAPVDGSLRQFVNGAIIQHYPTDLSRTEGTSFRLATEDELDRVLAFQLELGRLNDIDLSDVRLTDPTAEAGRLMFLDPNVGRCNECHANGGANFVETGDNRNFNTSVEQFVVAGAFIPIFDGGPLFDGGFGGQGLAEPDFASVIGVPDSFGDGTFNTPPVIEAADTGPWFHNNSFGNGNDPFNGIEGVVGFYGLPQFNGTPIGQQFASEFNGPIDLDGSEIDAIAAFLRVLNVALNIDMAIQRLEAAETLSVAFWSYRDDVALGLVELADAEVEDAVLVLFDDFLLHAVERDRLEAARAALADAQTTDPPVRIAGIRSALDLLRPARAALGTGMDYQMGQGNLMF